MNPQTEKKLRQLFRSFNRYMLLIWRLGLGRFINVWPDVGGRIMVVQHLGRKTGLVRRTPVNYAEIDGAYYCTAGFGSVSHWYRNLLANPEVELWLPNGRFLARAEDVTDEPNALALLRQVLINSGFAAPAAGVYPKTMSDDELAAATASYRLLRFTCQQPATGPGGPGDLVWVWPLVAILLAIGILLKRK